ncbi:ankyrin repeat protein [Paraburkholderia unamae]|uniref:ankyrin repeat domain-containing protein n=1 Tax=Paraburkholderia unamae TaxID=219649 RepID=UPI000DC5AC35|nr:ankyrin repeat domain-containing protein [Paraburkholderia unamae]RAR66838.1 ankyrin repeat protein [Paraburkholderia unamae]
MQDFNNNTQSIDEILASLTSDERSAVFTTHSRLLNAIFDREIATVKSLLRASSPVPLVHVAFNSGPYTGLSALHIAAQRGQAHLCRLLLEADAPLNAVTFDREQDAKLTPLDFARGNEHREVIRLLERESDRQGIDAESMQAAVERRPDGTVILAIVNRYTGDVLDYGRARLASDRAMNEPAIMGRIYDLMSDDRKVKVAPAGPAMH